MKSYTDLEQSKKLTEFLSLESADMFWQSNLNGSDRQYLLDMGEIEYFDIEMNFERYNIGNYDIPAWSLTALFGVLPKGTNISISESLDKIRYSCWNDYAITYASNPVDACVAMIEELHELNLL